MTVGGPSIILGVSEHIDEESLERYALGRSLASESEWIEEHLLVCGPCREALVILDRFIPAMRDALGKIGGGAAYAARKYRGGHTLYGFRFMQARPTFTSTR